MGSFISRTTTIRSIIKSDNQSYDVRVQRVTLKMTAFWHPFLGAKEGFDLKYGGYVMFSISGATLCNRAGGPGGLIHFGECPDRAARLRAW